MKKQDKKKSEIRFYSIEEQLKTLLKNSNEQNEKKGGLINRLKESVDFLIEKVNFLLKQNKEFKELYSKNQELNKKVQELSEESKEFIKHKKFNQIFKRHLIDNCLSGRKDLEEKELETLWEIYTETKKEQKKIKEEIINESNSDIKCPYCDNIKSSRRKECEECNKKIESIRVKDKCSKEEARKKYEKSLKDTE